jgi:hypothetical protein
MRAQATQSSSLIPALTRRSVSSLALRCLGTDLRLPQRIEHAGYRRHILQRNPPRFDPDGDIVEPSDEYEDEDDLEAVEENPYADIRLERT